VTIIYFTFLKINYGIRSNNNIFIIVSIRMGNVLNLVIGTTLPQHCHPGHPYQFELWSILICRAISEYIRRGVAYNKWIANDQFRMKSIFLCRTISACIRKSPIYRQMMADTQQHQSTRVFKSALYYIHKKNYEKGAAYDIFQVWIILLWRIIADYAYHMPINKKRMSIDLFANLPEVF
jgi:hypothetical protein